MAIEITPEIIADFRATYPIFTDPVKWPDPIVEDALCQGDMATEGCAWGPFTMDCSSRKRRGMYLYAAHVLTVMYPGGAETPETTPPANGGGAVQSKSVGDESISYATSTSYSAGEDWLRTTPYGMQYLMMSMQFCVGFAGGA